MAESTCKKALKDFWYGCLAIVPHYKEQNDVDGSPVGPTIATLFLTPGMFYLFLSLSNSNLFLHDLI